MSRKPCRSRTAALVLLAASVPAATGAFAQDFPRRPARLIVATSPGGGTDTLARILGAALSERMGQPFVIDNRPGGSGIVGTDLVARATPDGHTLLMGFIASLAITPAMMPTPYDPLKDQYPTLAEQGYPGFEVTSWYALMGPAALGQPIVAKLNGAVQEVLRTPEVRTQMERQGLEPTGGSPQNAAAHLERELATWKRVIKQAGIKPQ